MPKTLLDHINAIKAKSYNYDLLRSIQKQGKSIVKILNEEDLPMELDDAIFIVKINKFNDDLPQIILLVDEYYAAKINAQLKRTREMEFLDKINPEDLASKTKNFYEAVQKYNKNYSLHSLFPNSSVNDIIRDKIFSNARIPHADEESDYKNIYEIHSFFEEHNYLFKNFLNKFYDDGKESEKFMKNKFNTISKQYKYLKELNEKIEKEKIATDTTKEKEIQNNCHQKIDSIFEKYPSAVYKAIIYLLNYSENQTA